MSQSSGSGDDTLDMSVVGGRVPIPGAGLCFSCILPTHPPRGFGTVARGVFMFYCMH